MKSWLSAMSRLLVLSAVASPLAAADGVQLTERTTVDGHDQVNQIQIDRNRMRAESTTALGEKQAVVFDGAKQVLWIINLDKKTYNELTKADVDRMGGQVSDAIARLQDQLKNLPPEQRARMEQIIQGRGAATVTPTKVDYRKAGTDKGGKWTCMKYEGYVNNEKSSEVCTVDPKELGLTTADFEVTRQLAEFFKKLIPQNADRIFAIGTEADQGFSGVPVKRVATVAGRPTVTEITNIVRQTFPASTFELPPGLEKQDLGGPR